jgi:protein-disulfide isomerase
MLTALAVLGILTVAPGPAPGLAQETAKKSSVVAEVNGQPITEAQLEQASAGELLKVSIQRQRVLEVQLEQMIGARLVALEAEARKTSEADLIQREVTARVVDPTAEEISRFYEANKAQIREPADQVAPRIKQALVTQRRQEIYRNFVDQLKAKYKVKVLLPPLRLTVDAGASPARGPASAPVTIVLYSDFECPYCQTLAGTLAQAKKEYGDKVRLVFRQFPLTQLHPNAQKAAEASLCAADQGRFWEMHDELFKPGERLVPAELSRRANAIGLDTRTFDACLASGRQRERINADIQGGRALGVSSTPTLFVNGRPVMGTIPYSDLSTIVREELGRAAR